MSDAPTIRRLNGGGGNDTLVGGGDGLNGGRGPDSMRGGGGRESYWVDEARDRIIEAVPATTACTPA